MPTDENIIRAAEFIWGKLKSCPGVPIVGVKGFSPASLRVIDRLFESKREREVGCLLCFDQNYLNPNAAFETDNKRKEIVFQLGAYIGEVVRRYYGEKCEWGEGVMQNEMDLVFPNSYPPKPPLFPLKFIDEQIENHMPDDVAKWGILAGLRFEK